MGQQQIILTVLTVIIVGIAIVVGIDLFQANNISTNRDAMMNDINNLVGNAHAYYLKPSFLGGGNRSFVGYTIPLKMKKTDNGAYTLTSNPTMTTVFLTGTSSENDGVITAKIDMFHSEVFGTTFLNSFNDSDE
ncbi:MAG TPA: hypothetical protein VMU30_12970 [Bacteroidota bacterium]|nr:hypothetical protein [Bacteroidota bacterium]